VTEGEDKPLKYPVMFQKVDLVVLTKTDLLPHLPGVSADGFRRSLAHVAPALPLLEVSALQGVGLEAFIAWLGRQRERVAAAG
jgi:hydrogenase nickel incorporation protein HypB